MLTVFNIQRYSLHDGNGVRTNIFFKGCPLNCQWCNNPESIDPFPSIMFDERACNSFGDCIAAGEGHIIASEGKLLIDRGNIAVFEKLRDVCPSKALVIAGKKMSTDEIMTEIEKDIPFYEMSGGGVTITGGEPFAQDPELKELLRKIRARGIHISAETSLNIPWEVLESYTELVDVFLADLKHTDPVRLSAFTGGDAELITGNLRKLDARGCCVVVRVPVIPEFNFQAPDMLGIIDFVSGLESTREINFIPFHSLAREKYLMLGRPYIFENQKDIDKKDLLPFVLYAEQKGLKAKILN